jgi:hypothetical protein
MKQVQACMLHVACGDVLQVVGKKSKSDLGWEPKSPIESKSDRREKVRVEGEISVDLKNRHDIQNYHIFLHTTCVLTWAWLRQKYDKRIVAREHPCCFVTGLRESIDRPDGTHFVLY